MLGGSKHVCADISVTLLYLIVCLCSQKFGCVRCAADICIFLCLCVCLHSVLVLCLRTFPHSDLLPVQSAERQTSEERSKEKVKRPFE